MSPRLTRRAVLRSLGLLGAAAVSGCGSSERTPRGTATPDGTPTGTATTGGTPSPAGTPPHSDTPGGSSPADTDTTKPGEATTTRSDGSGRVVEVRLSGAPNGLQKYSLALEAATTIERVTPRLIEGPQFQVKSGGVGHTSVTFRGVDLLDAVGAFEKERRLATVTFRAAVRPSRLSIAVNELVADDGSDVDASRVEIAVRRADG